MRSFTKNDTKSFIICNEKHMDVADNIHPWRDNDSSRHQSEGCKLHWMTILIDALMLELPVFWGAVDWSWSMPDPNVTISTKCG
jgi:hypothetical protein